MPQFDSSALVGTWSIDPSLNVERNIVFAHTESLRLASTSVRLSLTTEGHDRMTVEFLRGNVLEAMAEGTVVPEGETNFEFFGRLPATEVFRMTGSLDGDELEVDFHFRFRSQFGGLGGNPRITRPRVLTRV